MRGYLQFVARTPDFASLHPGYGLIMEAEHEGLSLLTTAKDCARLANEPLLAALKAKAHVLPVRLQAVEAEELRKAVLEKLRP